MAPLTKLHIIRVGLEAVGISLGVLAGKALATNVNVGVGIGGGVGGAIGWMIAEVYFPLPTR